MAVRMPLKWALMGLLVGMAMVHVNSQDQLTNCDWLTPSNSGYISSIDCQETATVVRVFEDCPIGSELFTITNTTIEVAPDCQYCYDGGTTIYLEVEFDAEEGSGTKSCDLTVVGQKLFFDVRDINEEAPYPSGGTSSVMEVNIKENTPSPHEIAVIYYSDDDNGETSTLTSVLISTDYEDTFTLDAGDVDDDNNRRAFSFKTTKELDFEDQVFYKVEYNIISTDEKGNEKMVSHTFFVYVEDVPDNPPFWTDIMPFYELEECKEEQDLFQVTAQDRDVMVNYGIRYTFLEESEYFEIDNHTGKVSRKEPIDREDLLEIGISSFSLVIKATEYDETTGEDGVEPNSIEQGSTVTILDCNDETPEFDLSTYDFVMDEVTKSSGNQDLGLSIVVKDMDEGDNSTFTLETDQPEQVKINPTEGNQMVTVTLTALYKEDNSLFDYETQQSKPIIIEITATEKKNTSHINTSVVNITLRDVNDEAPVFLQDRYTEDVEEGTKQNTPVLVVEAMDDDVSPEFGKPSIRYSLRSPCSEFDIDPETGNVTLAMVLNFEDNTNGNNNLIECEVIARDENGAGLSNTMTTMIAITIIDVVDERPQFVNPVNPMVIHENEDQGTLVGPFDVTDADAEALISFKIQEAQCSDGTASTDVTGWFTVTSDTPNPPNFPAKVEVGDVNIDREMCNEVTLTIQANDNNTDEEYLSESHATESFIITILDENDELPIVDCENSCEDISVDEVDEINPNDASVLVFRVTVTDPDEEDTIQLSLSDGNDMMYLSKDTVTVEAGSVELIDVKTKEGAQIDREIQDTIDIEISFTDSGNHSSTKKVSIKVNDLNDKRPEINGGLCNGDPQYIDEDDGSGKLNGTSIGQILATDDDKESPHNHVRYMMLNDQIPDSKNTWTPFRIDPETGEVTILLIDNEKALDREQFANWELLFRAYDECDSSLTCKVLTSQPECIVSITVNDVNDNYPRDLTWLPDEHITVTDFLKKDEDLGYLLSAIDDDEGDNANLTYSVLGTYRDDSDVNMDLFRAEDEPFSMTSSCRLYANYDFEGANFTGEYTVTLNAEDGGGLSTDFNISMTVEDANDKVPYFVFGGCIGESEDNIIKMEENAYTPGENGQPATMEVKCGGPNGSPFIINVEDDDTENKNKIVTVAVDMENSTVENLGNGTNEQTLLSYWSLEPDDCVSDCRLKISHLIDREEGTAYNLSLKARNTALPLKESWAHVRVVVTNKMEYDPYFCTNGNCSQVVYMEENYPNAIAHFDKATDEDNNGVSFGDDQYNNVYYYIVGGDEDYFQTVSDIEETIVLKNLPNGLDREQHAEYSLKILVTNTEGEDDIDVGDLPRNDILNLIIRVRDVNDEDPVFDDDVIFTSFMESSQKEEHISTIMAVDLDLNETLTYEMLDDLQWFETDFIPDDPFLIERKDSRSVYLTLNFDPKGMTRGYCNFTITVKDLLDHMDEAMVKVYVINEDYQVAMYYSNEVAEVQSMSNQIEDIYSSVYNYKCTIDSIVPTQDTTGQTLVNKTTVYMHFIDEEINEPVADKIILDLSDSAEVMTQLLQRLNLIGINLDSVDTYLPPSDDKDPEETIRVLQILLGVVSLVLGLLVLLFATVYWLRTKKLQRKIKVLSTNTFGSKDEGLNQMGLDMASVPGSNYLAKEHGNHNPVFSENGGLEFKSQETDSISSGDSVLVGVEDNPEFKSYSTKGTPTSISRGFENPSYGRSIDDVSAAPPGVQGGMKGNPLLNLGDLKDEPVPSVPSVQSDYDGDSLGSQDNTAAVDQKINSNFSFL